MITLIGLLLLAVIAMFWPRNGSNRVFVGVMMLGLLASAVVLKLPNPLAQFPMLEFNRFTVIFSALFLGITGLVFLMLPRGVRLLTGHISEYATLLLFSVMGALVLASCTHVATLFIGIEMLSIPLYVLAVSNTRNSASHEAGLKYFILGSVASSVMVFGMALLFADTGQLYLSDLLMVFKSGSPSVLAVLGLCLLLFGLFFKVGLVPFHFWVPDVYQGTPLVFTGFMATVVKGAGFVVLFRIFETGALEGIFGHVVWVLAVLSMLLGNLIALRQTSIKRLLAYSSISHSGYIGMLLLTGTPAAEFILFFYILAYSVSILTLFFVYDLNTTITTDSLEPLNDLGRRSPLSAIAFVLAVLSLSGIPPLAGFFAKYILFVPVMGAGYVGLLLIAVISSVVGAVYYLRLLPPLFQPTSNTTVTPVLSKASQSVVVIMMILNIVIGICPGIISVLFH